MNKKLSIIFFLILFLFSGCVAKGPKFKTFDIPKDGKHGTLYIYGKDLIGFQIIVDGELLGDMKLKGYFVKKLPANKLVSIVANGDDKTQLKIKVKIPKNDVVCVKIHRYFLRKYNNFKIMNKNQCLSEIKYTRLIIEK